MLIQAPSKPGVHGISVQFLLVFCMAAMVRLQRLSGSVLKRHHHFDNKDKFLSANDPNPSPPDSMGAITLCQETQEIFLDIFAPPQKKSLRIFSSFSRTLTGALYNEK